ncbi:MAG: hypothetical protein CMF50_04430 [Legionellales bacterium]|nr:hypothetical protein [Legionellales bacterium]|tara:strand:- start:48 stop:2033 length:1986 start_codon:yes stop_codon:yes gene_type:complete
MGKQKYTVATNKLARQLNYADETLAQLLRIIAAAGFNYTELAERARKLKNKLTYLHTSAGLLSQLAKTAGNMPVVQRVTRDGETLRLPSCHRQVDLCEQNLKQLAGNTEQSLREFLLAMLDGIHGIKAVAEQIKPRRQSITKIIRPSSKRKPLDLEFLDDATPKLSTYIERDVSKQVKTCLVDINNEITKHLSAVNVYSASAIEAANAADAATVHRENLQITFLRDSELNGYVQDFRIALGGFPESFNMTERQVELTENLIKIASQVKELLQQFATDEAFQSMSREYCEMVNVFVLCGRSDVLQIATIRSILSGAETNEMVFAYHLGRSLIQPFEAFFNLFPCDEADLEQNSPLRGLYDNGFIVKLNRAKLIFSNFQSIDADPGLSFKDSSDITSNIKEFDTLVHDLMLAFFKELDAVRQNKFQGWRERATTAPAAMATQASESNVILQDKMCREVPNLFKRFQRLSKRFEKMSLASSTGDREAEITSAEQSITAFVDSFIQQYQDLQAPLRALDEGQCLDDILGDDCLDQPPSRPPPKAPEREADNAASSATNSPQMRRWLDERNKKTPTVERSASGFLGAVHRSLREQMPAASSGPRRHTVSTWAPVRQASQELAARRKLVISPRRQCPGTEEGEVAGTTAASETCLRSPSPQGSSSDG